MNPLYGGIVDIVTKSDIEAIFSNIFAIKELSDTLLESLESQFIRWPIYKLQFGETFEKLVSHFFKSKIELKFINLSFFSHLSLNVILNML